MRGSRTCARILALGVLTAMVLPASSARGQSPDVDACANAAEESQLLRRAGKLTAARSKLVACARATCPSFIQKDCAQWLGEVEKALPSVVVRAVDRHGKDVTSVRVRVDGDVVAESLDGRPLNVDPGKHVFTYESPGFAPVNETVLIRQAEANRLLSVSLGARADEQPKAEPAPAATGERGSIPTSSWVIGGAGAALAVVGAALWLSGSSDHSSMESGCARTRSCLQADVDSAETKLFLGDVAIGVGIVAIGAAVVLAVTRTAPARASSLSRELAHWSTLAPTF